MKLKLFIVFLFAALSNGVAQEKAPENWFNLDQSEDGVPGISAEKAYRDLLIGKSSQKVIVAVLDSGVDYEHEDLKDVMWINEDEIPNNGIDDDNNGYIDDIHGWNFLGNSNGENVAFANIEMTRMYKMYHKQFENKDTTNLSTQEESDFKLYKKYGKEIKRKRAKMEEEAIWIGAILQGLQEVKKDIGKEIITLEDLKNYKSDNQLLFGSAQIMIEWMSEGERFSEVELQLIETFEYYYERYQYYYNVDYDSREIVGDDINNLEEKVYGNNDVKGPDAEHGSHVAGIIGATRGNGKGINGVSDNVAIMSVRMLANGDEFDKDVANAIRYAVDNGASIINMSFGKGISPNKELVDEAIKYARKNDVLLIHAAGNENMKNTLDNHFPNDAYEKSGLFSPKFADNWIEVGAVDWRGGENLAAEFSNYGANTVDVFAPGVDMYSTVPENQYENHQGTSMAAPVVAGLAAILRSYFPALKASQVKDVIMLSAQKQKQKVLKPGTDKMVTFGQLSVTGGIINAYEAVKLAATVKGKKKISKQNASMISNDHEKLPPLTENNMDKTEEGS